MQSRQYRKKTGTEKPGKNYSRCNEGIYFCIKFSFIPSATILPSCLLISIHVANAQTLCESGKYKICFQEQQRWKWGKRKWDNKKNSAASDEENDRMEWDGRRTKKEHAHSNFVYIIIIDAEYCNPWNDYVCVCVSTDGSICCCSVGCNQSCLSDEFSTTNRNFKAKQEKELCAQTRIHTVHSPFTKQRECEMKWWWPNGSKL